MVAGKAILVIGIAAAFIIFVGPLGTLGPSITNFLGSFNPDSNTGELGSSAETSDGTLATQEGSGEGADGRASSQNLSNDGRDSEKADSEPKDTDKDGIPDKEEEETGTDKEKSDTDGDGVDDKDERDRGTDPRNRNTDRDRFDDSKDPQPTVKNTAFVRVMASKFTIQEDYTAMAGVILGPISGNVNPNTDVASVTVDIVFENIGDDFTSFVKFDGVFHVDGLEVKRTSKDIGRLEIGQKVTKQFTYTVKMTDIPPEVINRIVTHVVEGNHPVFSFEIKNIEFEKF